MIELNYLAIVGAALAAFVVSSVYYVGLGGQLAALSPAYADASRPPAWKIAQEPVRNLVIASVVAGLADLVGIVDVAGALQLGLALWIAFPVMILAGSVIHENVPTKLAAIHAGDWLVKLVLVAVIVAVWR
jgi:Protein of unknown function (DUF1761)